MPNLLGVKAFQVQTLARRWQATHPGEDPQQMPLEDRLANVKARMAYCLAHRIVWACSTGKAPPSMCEACGKPTFSRCEACYARLGATSARPYSGVCQECDAAKRVCHLCFGQQVTWAMGHDSYIQAHGQECQARIEVTTEDGVSTVRVTFDGLSQRLGRPAADIRTEILGSLAGPDPKAGFSLQVPVCTQWW